MVIHNAINSFRSSVIAVVISTKKPPGGLGWGKEKGTAPGNSTWYEERASSTHNRVLVLDLFVF